MITQKQRTKILAIYGGAHERIERILTHFPIVQNEDFETSVFLFALSGIAFGEATEEVIETIGGELELYSFEEKGDEDISRRMTLYGLAADSRIIPCGFWSPIGIDALCGRPESRMAALFGDILVCPECVTNYGGCQWPLLFPRDQTTFRQVFISRVIPEAYRYLSAIAEVLSEQTEEE